MSFLSSFIFLNYLKKIFLRHLIPIIPQYFYRFMQLVGVPTPLEA